MSRRAETARWQLPYNVQIEHNVSKPREDVPAPGICSSVVQEEDDPMGLRAGIWQVMEAKKNNVEGTPRQRQ